ncbi:conserved hypothetical protein [Leishmania braziliensis MHOM/BR/75/M2904]|uniref:Uncharacterized protein n=2 Tax=Leishmania braziliensis TaxID=5660 RepID=A4HI57_LEIBR|nr:conserved hypothetical protein [Leishmania braziliensis MHOM/BR/75/M2904]CAJ2477085.1 unnamed protein product [Leishmania braziliensis]CAM40263.1 conserved hypothetical protein [Leishmania braziliensis MHOM/BR/75/M2904]SYZ67923.1 hypothetical_protein [Leishmania braziliensis MHOM/BR/75/M2904]
MIRLTYADLGRWSSRDFLRSRSKRAGAVHTRHTHGRRGRYKRLSSITSSIRDGRRHASNHMQGGLGVKLGSGLFGLRIPRQHQLSRMSKAEFDLEVYGHPNITNPYREHLDEHPDLKSVMMNATVVLRLVVLLPKVARRSVQREGGDLHAPEEWLGVVREIKVALSAMAANARQAVGAVEVHLATLETSVSCCCTPSDVASAPAARNRKEAEVGPDLEASVARLYRTHCLLGSRLKPESEATAQHRRPAAFMGIALRAPPPMYSSNPPGSFAVTASSTPFTSSVLASLTKDTAAPSQMLHRACSTGTRTADRLPCTSMISSGSVVADVPEPFKGKGMTMLVRECSATEQPLLRLCMRPSVPAGTSTHRPLSKGCSGANAVAAAAAVTTRKVLRKDIDLNSEVGVWRLAQSSLPELLRWHYCAQDPRAHNHDALPHHRRPLPVLLVVDYSTINRKECSARTQNATSSRPAATLMPRHLSLELESAGFRLLAESSLLDVAKSLEGWMPTRQWEDYLQSCAHRQPHSACKAVPIAEAVSP